MKPHPLTPTNVSLYDNTPDWETTTVVDVTIHIKDRVLWSLLTVVWLKQILNCGDLYLLFVVALYYILCCSDSMLLHTAPTHTDTNPIILIKMLIKGVTSWSWCGIDWHIFEGWFFSSTWEYFGLFWLQIFLKMW